MSGHILLSVLVFRRANDPNTWIFQALEHNIVAHGPDIDHARRAFERTVSGYIDLAEKRGQEPLAAIRPAAPFFWKQWDKLASRNVQAERFQTTAAYMLPVVNNDPIPA